ncbi:Cytochrome C oxidase, cbb3-type, subunit III [Pedobacter sp. ok626]|uniref:c-type cytochrome n=1 Tax=Pedobacter sp. ok626 TaxID=1761882 RepID=UPI000886F0EB|nr:cytochrome c [Pedobacter sp. ok626]SDL02380.1 Cytochrome C oxidase, cbb3-type, subunit III [Pedobacter sp. ok626]
MRRFLIGTLFLLLLATIIYSCQDAGQIKQDVYYVNGRDLYIKHCQNCHGAKGEGLGTLTPPLTDSVFLKSNREKLACYIKNGIKDSIVINGIKYEGTMPAFPELYDIDIAQLLVYISNSFGNKQGMYTTESVATDLKNCK